jgi:hypothetical protein
MAKRYVHSAKQGAKGFRQAAFLPYTRKMIACKIPQIFFDALVSMSDAEAGGIIKCLIVYMMTDGAIKGDLKFEKLEHSVAYDTLIDVTRRCMTSSKRHLKADTLEDKQTFKRKHIGYDTEAIETAINDIESTIGDDGWEIDDSADGMPETTLLTDTLDGEEYNKKRGGRVGRPAPFSPRRDIIEPSRMPVISDAL